MSANQASVGFFLTEIFDPFLRNPQSLLRGDEPSGANIATVIDISGSTVSKFGTGIETVLNKEIAIAKNLALENADGNTFLFTFESTVKSHGRIGISSSGDVMFPPGIKSCGGTNTPLGLSEVLRTLPSTKVTTVHLITDGQIDPGKEAELCKYAKELRDKDVEINVIAVSSTNIDFQNLTATEQRHVPGLDVVNILNTGATCYTPKHYVTPYKLATSCDTSTRNWNLLEISIPKKSISMVEIINMIINGLLDANGIDYSTQSVQDELQQLFMEIGMMLGTHYVTYPTFFTGILSKLQTRTSSDLTEFVKFGFDLKKTDQPLILAGIKQQVIEYRTQKNNYTEATNTLEIKGTALDGPAISFINGMVCIKNDLSSLTRNGIFSIDSAGNIFFAFDVSQQDEQAIRQGLRSFFGEKLLRFQNCRSNPSVIFGVASQILMFMLSNPELTLDNKYIMELRRLALIQIGQKLQNRDQTYGNSFAQEWLSGNIPLSHYSQKTTHADCFSDPLVNPLCLPQTLWWALMMMIFGNGLFEAQMPYYQEILRTEGIDPTEVSLFEHLRGKYSSKVTGTAKFLTCDMQQSIITLCSFLPGERVFESLSHTSLRGGECNTHTQYSDGELQKMVNKCVWCGKTLSQSQFREIQNFSENDFHNPNPARFISQVQTSRASHGASHTVSGGGSTVFTQLPSGEKKKIVMHVSFGKGKNKYDSYATAVKSAISSDSIDANIMEYRDKREIFLRSAVQQFQSSSSNRTLSYVGGDSDLVPRGDSYYFWRKILVGKIADIEVEYIRY